MKTKHYLILIIIAIFTIIYADLCVKAHAIGLIGTGTCIIGTLVYFLVISKPVYNSIKYFWKIYKSERLSESIKKSKTWKN